MNQHLLDERIEAYIKNALTPEEKGAFELEMQADFSLVEAVTFTRELMEATDDGDIQQFRAAMDSAYNTFTQAQADKPDVQKSDSAAPTAFTFRRFYLFMAAAATLILLLAAVWFFYPGKSEEAPLVAEEEKPLKEKSKDEQFVIESAPEGIADKIGPEKKADKVAAPKENKRNRYIAMAEELNPGYAISTIRKAGETTEQKQTKFANAEAAFAEKNYAQALTLLAKPDRGFEESSAYLEAHALFKLKRYKEAQSRFMDVVQMQDIHADEASWLAVLSGLAALGPNDPNVQSGLKQITEDSGHPFQEKGIELQNQLNLQ